MAARVVSAPGVESGRRETKNPERRTKREHFAGAVDGSEQGVFGLAVGEPRPGEPEPGEPQEGEKQPNDGAEDSDPTPQLENLCLELLLLATEDVEGDNLWWLGTEPSRSCGAWNSETGGERNIACLVNELAEPVVVAARRPSVDHGGAS